MLRGCDNGVEQQRLRQPQLRDRCKSSANTLCASVLQHIQSLRMSAGLQRQSTLSKQASAMFNMTLDQYQQSMGSGKPFGSLNMVRS